MRLKGDDVALYAQVGGVYEEVGFATNCSLNVTADIIEVSSALHARAKGALPGRYSWSMNTSNLVESEDSMPGTLLRALKQGTRLLVAMSVEIDGVKSGYYGYAYVRNFSKGAPMSSMATYNVEFAGDDELLEL